MPLKRRHLPFNTHVVMKEDLDYRNAILTDQLMQRMVEITRQQGIIQCEGADGAAYEDSGDVKIPVLRGYVDGERVEIESVQTVAVGEGDDVVIAIEYKATADADENATRLDDEEDPHTVWWTDGYLITKTNYAAWIAEPPATKIPICRASKTSGEITITDMRPFLTLGLPLPDLSVTAAKLAASAVTNAKIANYAVSNTKLLNLAVNESKLAEGTDLVPLAACRDEEPTAGSSVSLPCPFTTYACATGGTYEYKILGRMFRDVFAGPMRRLRLLATADSAGTGTGKVYLVAWAAEPAAYDPEDGDYDGIVASQEVTTPGGGAAVDIELDLLELAVGEGQTHITYGLVMVNNLDETLNLTRVLLVAIR